jgi:hypothetical protein
LYGLAELDQGDLAMSRYSPMRVLGLLSSMAIAALPGAVIAQEPEQRDLSYAANNGKTQPAHQFYVEKGPNRYSVTVVDFFDGPKADDQIVEHAAANMRLRGALFHQDFATYDPGMPGRQINVFITKERQIRASVYMAEHRLYITEADAAAGDIPAVQFEQSITLVDEKGFDLDRVAPNGEPSPRQFKCR